MSPRREQALDASRRPLTAPTPSTAFLAVAIADQNILRSGLPSAQLFASAAQRDLLLALPDSKTDDLDASVIDELRDLAADLP